MKRKSMAGSGTAVCDWMRMCAGSVASRYAHQRRGGASMRAAIRIEFGGQTMEVGMDGNLTAKPTFDPT
jgi:hypothetical protein